MTVKVIIAKQKFDCKHLMGQFVDESHFDFLVDEDCDVYMPEIPGSPELTGSEERIVLKFRKNFFTQEQQDQAYAGLREAATETQNRGAAAGPRGEKLGNREWVTEYEYDMVEHFLDPKNSLDGDPVAEIRARHVGKPPSPSNRNNVWSIDRVKKDKFVFEDWVNRVKDLSIPEQKKEAKYVADKLICATTYANSVYSGIAGWFDRYPRIPYGRATSYTQRNPEKFAMSYPFLQHLAEGFKQFLPQRYAAQMAAANKVDPRFLVPETPFTTVTVNKTFRTAAHYDVGDLNTGLSNLLTLSPDGKYTGAYLVCPEYRIAVNPRPGDLLLINNHEVMHGNTEIKCEEGSERISLVVYFREKMLELGSYEYENCRYDFVESRRLNKEHKFQKPLWNGVSEGMWESDEWYQYLESKLGKDELIKYHPKSQALKNGLEEFFG